QKVGHGPIQSHGSEHDQHDSEIGERVNVECVDEMVDIKNAFAQIKNFEDEGEERDAAEHHVREIADHGDKEQLKVRSVLAELLFGMALNPFLKSIGRRCGILPKLHNRAIGLLCFKLFVRCVFCFVCLCLSILSFYVFMSI